jgi:aminobutyraldehyde dehydrogenase
MQHNLLINGELVAGEGEMVPVFNPANGEVILQIAKPGGPGQRGG